MKISAILIFLTFVMMTTSARTNTISDISFSRDGIILQGRFFKAEGAGPFATVLILPGFPGNQTDVLGLGKMISEAGINVLTFNYCGTHRSQGEFSFENSQKDIDAAYSFLAQKENIKSLKSIRPDLPWRLVLWGRNGTGLCLPAS
jgi:predicted alpha/beta hydrolase